MAIAEATGEGQIGQRGRSAVLLRDDVIDVKRHLGEFFGEMAILRTGTGRVGAPPHAGTHPCDYSGRGVTQRKAGLGLDELQGAADVQILIKFLGFLGAQSTETGFRGKCANSLRIALGQP